MRRIERLDGLIRTYLRQVKLREEKASIVLEAAIVMPVIMLLLLAFLIFIHISATQLALQSSAIQAVRLVAAHWHPVDQTLQQLTEKFSDEAEQTAESETSTDAASQGEPWRELASTAAKWLPDPTGTLLSSALSGDWQPTINLAATELGRFAIEPLVREHANDRFLQVDKIVLEQLTIPDFRTQQQAEFGLVVSYSYPIKVPLLNTPIILHAGAVERAWIPDTVAANYGDAKAEEQQLAIISIEPTPVRPGRKATVVVQTNPGETVSLEVLYKSGLSKARHLGEATADASGLVTWTWHVSGNTTPGLWEVSATSHSQEGLTDHKFFSVEKIAKTS